MDQNLHIGTCSWKFPAWRGIVYSGAKGANLLEEYARHFGWVEIDQWFWSLFGPDKVALPQIGLQRRAILNQMGAFTAVANAISREACGA